MRSLCIKSITAWNFYCSLQAKGSSQSFWQGHHLVQNHVPYNKIFVLRACTKVCGSCGRLYSHMQYARKAKKLHLGIQMLVTARALESTVINYIYSCSPWRGNLFGGGPISIHYSIRKLQYVIENERLNHTKIRKNCLRRESTSVACLYI